ncbi:MAG: hypothetical protein CMN85_10850 [Spongiibacteraceae bacterium]|uniref:hypothetical protein n=1 Tax=uncultured Haliea sp. TaxID=622616 RepID=UPI000C488F0D|nr:hypothetical protein [Spongiibacteraceae bacterium]
MAKVVLTDALLAFDGVKFSDTANEVAVDYAAESLDGTVFGNDTRVRCGGLFTAAMSASGFFQAEDPDKAFFQSMGAAGKVMTAAATATEGDIAYTLAAIMGSYQPIDNEVGELAGFSMSVGATDKLIRGTLMANKETITSTSSGTARQLGAVTSAQKLYAALHVFSAGGTSPTLDIEIESDDGSGMASPVSRISFDQATAVGSQFKSLAGAITDDWWRVKWTVGGTSPDFDFLVVVGIL